MKSKIFTIIMLIAVLCVAIALLGGCGGGGNKVL